MRFFFIRIDNERQSIVRQAGICISVSAAPWEAPRRQIAYDDDQDDEVDDDDYYVHMCVHEQHMLYC